MLATITLATDNDWIGVWIGSTVGMVAADALAIIVGSVLGKHLPDGFIKIGAAVLFFVFGVWLLLEGIFPDSSAGIIGGGVVLAVSVLGALARIIWKRSRATDSDTHLVDDNRTPID